MKLASSQDSTLRNRRHLPPTSKIHVPFWLASAAVILYFGLFVLTVCNPENAIKTDSLTYMKLAVNLRSHHMFSLSDAPPFVPETYRLPGYPVFLALTGGTSM